MGKTKIMGLGIILALLSILVFAGGCYPVTTSTTATDGSDTAASTWTSLLPMIGFIVVLFGLMYFFTIRPQRKRQQESQKMLQTLQRGDRVITNAGIYGQIESVYEDSFLLKTDSGATMRVAKWAVVGKQPEDTVKTG
ncbi:MAG: preprotein translocase subunit YajC [Dehalococcoidales bacterium]|nr:preprotein translocase subunit YajC [Dehalococcoidales bacterium]